MSHCVLSLARCSVTLYCQRRYHSASGSRSRLKCRPAESGNTSVASLVHRVGQPSLVTHPVSPSRHSYSDHVDSTRTSVSRGSLGPNPSSFPPFQSPAITVVVQCTLSANSPYEQPRSPVLTSEPGTWGEAALHVTYPSSLGLDQTHTHHLLSSVPAHFRTTTGTAIAQYQTSVDTSPMTKIYKVSNVN